MAAVENATDDGTLDTFSLDDEDESELEDCDCDGLGGFLCWPCVRTGRTELPNEPLLQLFLSMTRQLTFSDITIRLSWDTYNSQGWEQFSSTVRHELIHAWQYHEFGDADHGTTFTRWTDRLDTSRHCEGCTTPTWWLICKDCGGRSARYRRSKTVRNPEKYSCSQCGGAICIEKANNH